MKTTIELDDSLAREATAIAAATGKSLDAVVEEALRQSMMRRRQLASEPRVELMTHGHGGLQPGVNLDNTAALLELMDKPNAAP